MGQICKRRGLCKYTEGERSRPEYSQQGGRRIDRCEQCVWMWNLVCVCLGVQGKSKKTVLHIAAEKGHGDVVEKLVKKGADVNCITWVSEMGWDRRDV